MVFSARTGKRPVEAHQASELEWERGTRPAVLRRAMSPSHSLEGKLRFDEGLMTFMYGELLP